MLSDVLVSEVATIIICLGAVVSTVVLLTKPIVKTIKKLENHDARLIKIENMLFNSDGSLKIPVESEYRSLDKNTREIKNAVNVLAGTIMILIDSQIGENNKEQLQEAKDELLKKREFV